MNPDGTQDVNTVSLYDNDSGGRLQYGTIDGSRGTAGLKITSRAKNLSVTVERIVGGSENCVDLNNECQGVVVNCGAYEIHGKYGISAKTCNGVTFMGHLKGRARQWEINLGSWSDQSKRTQAVTNLELTADAYPIRVWVGNAEIPKMDDPKKYQLIGFGKYGAFVRSVCMFFWGIGKLLKIA
jgi:hypothetical protein